MKVSLVTYYAVRNIGDRILTDVVSWLLRNRGCTVRVVDLQARYPYRFSGFVGQIESWLVRHFRKIDRLSYFQRCVLGSDVVVFGGGAILTAEDCEVSENIQMIVGIAEQLKIPVFFNAIGVDKYPEGKLSEGFLKSALLSPSIAGFTVREDAALFNRTFLPCANVKASWVCDTAVWCREAYSIRTVSRSRKNVVGVNIIAALAYRTDPVERYVRLCSSIMALGFQCVLFTNGVPRDVETARIVQRRLTSQCRYEHPRDFRSGKSFVTFLCQFDYIVSSRLHTSICAFSLGIPTVALSWDNKFKCFYQSIKAENRCYDIITETSDNEIVETLFQPMPQIDSDAYRATVLASPVFGYVEKHRC